MHNIGDVVGESWRKHTLPLPSFIIKPNYLSHVYMYQKENQTTI